MNTDCVQPQSLRILFKPTYNKPPVTSGYAKPTIKPSKEPIYPKPTKKPAYPAKPSYYPKPTGKPDSEPQMSSGYSKPAYSKPSYPKPDASVYQKPVYSEKPDIMATGSPATNAPMGSSAMPPQSASSGSNWFNPPSAIEPSVTSGYIPIMPPKPEIIIAESDQSNSLQEILSGPGVGNLGSRDPRSRIFF